MHELFFCMYICYVCMYVCMCLFVCFSLSLSLSLSLIYILWFQIVIFSPREQTDRQTDTYITFSSLVALHLPSNARYILSLNT